MKIDVSHSHNNNVLVTILNIAGAIDSSNFQELDQAAEMSIQTGARYMLMDLSNVRFMSSAALRSLQKIDKKLNALSQNANPSMIQQGVLDGSYRSPYLKLLNPTGEVMLVLQTAGWDMLFEIHRDIGKAVRSFGA